MGFGRAAFAIEGGPSLGQAPATRRGSHGRTKVGGRGPGRGTKGACCGGHRRRHPLGGRGTGGDRAVGRDNWRDGRRGLAAGASNGDEGPVSSEEEPQDARATHEEDEDAAGDDENSFLLKFVQEVKPQVMEQFTAQASPEVVEAMKQTISNMIGTLPAKYFDVTIKTVGENLAQLMLSVMMTGYMFRNAQYRMDVTKTMALPSPSDEEEEEDNTDYAEGSQQLNISGEVLRWHNEKGAESVDAMEYIEKLERELSTLREQLSMHEKVNEERNYLLEYLQRLEPSNMKELTSGVGEEVVDAMNAFIKRLVGTDYDSEELRGIESQSNSVEMARLLYWLLIVGYSLRTIEARKEVENVVDETSQADQEEEEEGEEREEEEPLASASGEAAGSDDGGDGECDGEGEGEGEEEDGDDDDDDRGFMDRSFDDDAYE